MTQVVVQPDLDARPSARTRVNCASDRQTRGAPSKAGDVPVWVTRALWSAVVLGLLVRLAAIAVSGAYESTAARHTAMEHRSVAIHLLSGEGFAFRDWGYFGPSSVQSPPYPLLLAGAFATFGVDSAGAYAAVLVVNALAGALTVWLTYWLATTLTPVRHRRSAAIVGVIAATLVAVWPTQVYAVTFAQAIALITAGTLAIIGLWQISLDTGRLGPWVAYGVIGCVAALTEPVLLPVMAVSGLLVLIWPAAGLTPALRLRNAALLLLTAIVVIGPWSYRNYRVHGELVPIKSTFWVNVWKGNNPNASGTDRPLLSDDKRAALLAGMTDERRRDPTFDDVRQYDLLTPEARAELMHKTDPQREAVFGAWAKSWIARNPVDYARLCLVRLAKTLWVEWDNPKSWDRLYVYATSRTLLLLTTPVGLFLAWRAGWRIGFALVTAGLCLLTYTLTITAARFALTFEPMQLALLSMIPFVCLARVTRRSATSH